MKLELVKPVRLSTSDKRLFLLDLIIYFAVMFLIREIYFSEFNFITNGLFWSISTLILASIFIRNKNTSWKALGLTKPQNLKTLCLGTIFILCLTMLLIIGFEVCKDLLELNLKSDSSELQSASKFGALTGNWLLFFSIIPFIWLQSALEEMLDRGFLINWVEQALSFTWISTIVAILFQAIVFGFRHSYDLSERSITVALIGLSMGIGYILFKRNLWPLIIAHCLLNTISMIDRI